MAEKLYTESEVKELMRLAYDKGNNYAYYCMVYPESDANKEKAEQFAIEGILKNPGKHLRKRK